MLMAKETIPEICHIVRLNMQKCVNSAHARLHDSSDDDVPESVCGKTQHHII